MEGSESIKCLPDDSARRIGAGQVVVDIASAVKELVENSLDANATSVEIRLTRSGLDAVEVVDNGSGVPIADRHLLARKHHTSKLRTFDGITSARSFGFRGEALSALAASCSSLAVTTKREGDTSAERLIFADNGSVSSREAAPRSAGTTVTVHGLLAKIPVRRKHIEVSLKREHLSVLNVLQAYALIATHARIVCTHIQPQEGSGTKRSTILSTQASGSLRDNIVTLFGSKAASCIEQVDVPLGKGGARAVGFVSKATFGSGRTSNDRQFIFANGRPIDIPKLNRAANEVYRSHNAHGSPMLILDMQIPREEMDINVTPNKRTVMLQDEDAFVQAFRDALSAHYEPNRNTFSLENSANGRSVLASEQSTRSAVSAASRTKSKRKRQVALNHEEEEAEAASDSDGIEHEHNNGEDDMNIERHSYRHARVVDDDSSNDEAALPNEYSERQPSEHEERRASRSMKHGALSKCGQESGSQQTVTRHSVNGQDPQQQQRVGASQNSAGFEREKMKASFQSLLSNASAAADRGAQSERRTGNAPGTSLTQLRMQQLLQEQDKDYHCNSAFGPEPVDVRREDSERNGPELTRQRVNAMEGIPVDDDHKRTTSQTHDQGGGAEPQQQPEGEELELGHEMNVDDDELVQDHGAVSYDEVKKAQTGSDPTLDNSGNGHQPLADVQLQTSIAEIAEARKRRAKHRELLRRSGLKSSSKSKFKHATVMADVEQQQQEEQQQKGEQDRRGKSKEAEEELKRVLSKEHFSQMTVVGQFNLGFIVCVHGSDVFVIDQHASDEIRNFERLQMTTKVKKQPMIIAQPLGLSPSEEHIARSNEAVFNANGFSFIDSSTSGELCLSAVPFSRQVTFGVSDVQELIAILEQQPWREGNTAPAPSRVHSMLAMRACRSSIMVGSALTKAKMQTVVANLSGLSVPWNCPHGRPTLRFLANLSRVRKNQAKRQRSAAAGT